MLETKLKNMKLAMLCDNLMNRIKITYLLYLQSNWKLEVKMWAYWMDLFVSVVALALYFPAEFVCPFGRPSHLIVVVALVPLISCNRNRHMSELSSWKVKEQVNNFKFNWGRLETTENDETSRGVLSKTKILLILRHINIIYV